MLQKVPKVAVLRSICSDLGRDSVYSNEMHSGHVRRLGPLCCLYNKMLKKVPKVAVLQSICSDLGRDSVCSNKMHNVNRTIEDKIISVHDS